MVSRGGSNLGDATLVLRADRRQLNRDLDRAEQNVKRRLENFSRRATAGGALLAGFGAVVTAGVGLAVKAASDLQESTNAVNVVFGAASQTVHEFGQDSARSAGIATAAFNQLAAQTGSLLINFGSTQQESADQTLLLTQRAADLASVYNTSVADAMSAVNQAIRGETEAIRRYSADVTDATIQTHLNAQGINAQVSAMSVAEKAQLRLQVLMAQTANVQGDFDRTSGDIANALRIAQAEVTNLMAELGTGLLPILAAVLRTVVPIVTWVKDWAAAHPRLSSAIFITVAALGAFALFAGLALISAGLVAGAIGTLGITMAGVTGVATAMWIAITGPVGLIIAGIVALIAVGVYLYHRFDAVRNIVDAAWRAIKDFAADAVKSLQPLIEALGYIVGLLGSVWDFLKIPPSPEALTMDTRPLAIIEAEMQQNTGELAQEAGKEMQKATSALTTGRTRWRNVRLEEAQEDSATKIVDAVEQQTRDLIPPIEGIDAGAPDGFKWTDLIPSLSWLPFIPIFGWNAYIGRLNWWTWISSLSWSTWIKNLSWWTWIKSLSWWTWIKNLSWWTWIKSLSWWTWIKNLSWWTWIKSLSWSTWIKSLSWSTWISSLSWWTWIKNLSWWTWISSLSWWTWISSLSWWTWIKSLSWSTWIKSLSWSTWISSLSWWTWISSLSWWTWIKSLSWSTWIKSLSWSTWISSLSWRSFIPNLNWGAFIDKVRDIGSKARDIGSSAVSDIGSKARDIGSSAVSDVRDFFTDISPWHGAGGIAMAPHLAVVGDVPEAIIPLDRLASIMGGGRTMVFNVENLYGVDDLEDFVQEANLAALRRGQENVLT